MEKIIISCVSKAFEIMEMSMSVYHLTKLVRCFINNDKVGIIGNIIFFSIFIVLFINLIIDKYNFENKE